MGWPSGQVAGAEDSPIGRRSSNRHSHSLQRYSYTGIAAQCTEGAIRRLCLTTGMSEHLHPSAGTVLDQQTDETTQTGEPVVAHIVKTEPGESAAAKVVEARVFGSPLEALCGHVWVPSRDPKQLPMCQACKEIYELYRSMNDGLSDRPSE